MLKTRAEYKEQAKALMAGKYGNVVLILVIVTVVVGAITGLFSGGGDYGLTSLASIIDFLLSVGVSYGFVRLWKNVVDGKESDLQDILLCGYKENYVRTLLVQLLVSIFVFLYFLLLIIPGIVKAYSYSLCFYLLHKDHEIKQMDVLKKSEKLMMGHKNDLFMLDLSYIGWYFLGLLTLGILLIWVVPKHQTARMLYLDEIYNQAVKSEPAPVVL